MSFTFPKYDVVLLTLKELESRNRRRNQNQLTTLVLSLTVVSLFCSTTVYTVATLQLELEQIYSQVVNGFELWSSAVSPGMILTGSPALSSEGMRQFVYCAPTAALTINVCCCILDKPFARFC